MIILDTHVWIWWVHGDPLLLPDYRDAIQDHEATGLGLSAISCWEVAKLVESGRLKLPEPISEWMKKALAYPGMELLPVSPDVAIESTQLPQPFHKDPADQIIVATARIHNAPLITCDAKIRAYRDVKLLI